MKNSKAFKTLMDNQRIQELVNIADSRKSNLIEDRIQQLNHDQQDFLLSLVVLNEYLNVEEIYRFLEICRFHIASDELSKWIEQGITESLIEPNLLDGVFIPYFRVNEKVQEYLWENLTEEEKNQKHRYAEKFYQQIFLEAVKDIYADEPIIHDMDDEELTKHIIQPGGFIDFGAHYPQAPKFHNWSILRAFYWQEHLFSIGKFEEAAHIANAICFSLARKGKKKIAKGMLLRNVAVLKGIHRSTALVNFATLLRGDQEHRLALRLYRRALLPLVWHRAIRQLAGVFSEVSNIHRDLGHLTRALIYQHLSGAIRSMIRDLKGKAICNNQLSILYRTLKLRSLAIRYSKAAEKYWRRSEDEVNLAKTLLTQGNIYYRIGQSKRALVCFDESAEINLRIESFSEAASSISGKARANIQLGKFDEAKKYLEDAISLRERCSDRRIGIEYENMGGLYEVQGNYALALGWYKKALAFLEKYQPAFADHCQQKIRAMNNRIQKDA